MKTAYMESLRALVAMPRIEAAEDEMKIISDKLCDAMMYKTGLLGGPPPFPYQSTLGRIWANSRKARFPGIFITRCQNGKLTIDPVNEWDMYLKPEPEWCEHCHNTGSLDCHCGGDLCVCENHGEYPCPHCRGENDD
jgi:hypothetical protein